MSDASRKFAAFSWLSAASTVFYHAQLRVPLGADFSTAALAAAVVVLFRPASIAPLIALAALQSSAVWVELPFTNTNRLLQLFVGVGILISAASLVVRRRRLRISREEAYEAIRVPQQAILLVTYFWAILHKLNWGFLSPADSCAVAIFEQFPTIDTLPDWARTPIIGVTLVTESLMVPLLLFQRTRWLGVRIGATFHAVLGLAWFYSFSATMLALLVLFVPDKELGRAIEWVRQRLRASRMRLALAIIPALLLVAAVFVVDPRLERSRGLLAGWTPGLPLIENVNAFWESAGGVFYVVWTLWLPVVGLMWWLALWRRATPVPVPSQGSESSFWAWRHAPALGLVIVAMVFVNGASPYVGWKTETSFAMYSNLRTEPGYENHLFLPTLDLFPYQRDLVQIRSSSDPHLSAAAAEGRPIPLIEVRRRVAEMHLTSPAVSIVCSVGGVEHRTDDARRHPLFSQPLSYAEQKLLRFREIRPAGCSH